MNRLVKKQRSSALRKSRVRATVIGTSERPRLAVRISNLHISAQIIDDSKHHTLVYVTTVGQKVTGTMKDKAVWIGSEIAKKSKTSKITKVAFDRGDKQYHGRIKAVADAAREGGLEF